MSGPRHYPNHPPPHAHRAAWITLMLALATILPTNKGHA